MLATKNVKLFILLSLIFKTLYNAILSFNSNDVGSPGFFVVVTYSLFNFILLLMVCFEPLESVRKSAAIATTLDLFYAVIMNMVLRSAEKWNPLTYPTCMLLYVVGSLLFIKYRLFYFILGIFALIFLGDMIYNFFGNYTNQNKTFIALMAFSTFFIFYIASQKKDLI